MTKRHNKGDEAVVTGNDGPSAANRGTLPLTDSDLDRQEGAGTRADKDEADLAHDLPAAREHEHDVQRAAGQPDEPAPLTGKDLKDYLDAVEEQSAKALKVSKAEELDRVTTGNPGNERDNADRDRPVRYQHEGIMGDSERLKREELEGREHDAANKRRAKRSRKGDPERPEGELVVPDKRVLGDARSAPIPMDIALEQRDKGRLVEVVAAVGRVADEKRRGIDPHDAGAKIMPADENPGPELFENSPEEYRQARERKNLERMNRRSVDRPTMAGRRAMKATAAPGG
jgi:hypothetical protein